MLDNIYLNKRKTKYLQRLKNQNNSDTKAYILKGDFKVISEGYTLENNKYVNLSGGYTLLEGSDFRKIGKIIYINKSPLGYIIILE